MEIPRGYPESIETKVRHEVGPRTDDSTFNTEKQLNTAEVILDMWPATFLDISKEAPVSRPIVPDVIEDYFGPEGTDLTFGEIEEHFGSYKQYQRARTLGVVGEVLEKNREELDGIAAILGTPSLSDEVSDREFEMYLLGRKEGFEGGFSGGFTYGWDAREEHESRGGKGSPLDESLISEFGSTPNH